MVMTNIAIDVPTKFPLVDEELEGFEGLPL
jgi:hypothetical protein